MITNTSRRLSVVIVLFTTLALVRTPAAQELTGALEGIVRDATGGAIPGARVRLSSATPTGGPAVGATNERGEFRFLALAPGSYVLDVDFRGFAPAHDEEIRIGGGATLKRTVVLNVAGAESVVVEGRGSRTDVQDPGFATRYGDEIRTIPTRRASMFDFLRAAPWISPTSPSSGITTTMSAAGSGTNENQFLIDGTNHTCPCNGVARAEPGIDFIQEIQVRPVGASAEFGNVQGAVVNVVTRQGTDRLSFDGAYFGQSSRLTAQSAVLASATTPALGSTGYARVRYRDATANLGGPLIPGRAWFFLGTQHLRDADSQPGADPAKPRNYREDKFFGKLSWRVGRGWQMEHTVHDEHGVVPDRPTNVTPFEAISQPHISVPATTFAHVTHTSGNSVFDARVGRFRYQRDEEPATGDWTAQAHLDRLTGVSSGAPSVLSRLTLIRTTGNAEWTRVTSNRLGADHAWKAGVQVERGEHRTPVVIAGGARFVETGATPFQKISSDPSNTGGRFVTVGLFATDAIRVGSRLTIDAGVRVDHSRAISQDLQAVDDRGRETGVLIPGRGTLYTWNLVSPRLGLVLRLDGTGATTLRFSGGRYSQGVLTGEIGSFAPGATSITTATFDPATGAYSRLSVFDPSRNLQLDPDIRAPHTDEYSIGVDREIGRRLAVSAAYVRKHGADFIGWTDVGGRYVEQPQPALPDGRVINAFVLTNAASDRVFRMTNPPGYSLTYDGVVTVVEKRRSHGWQAFGSYTWSRASGLVASSGAVAAGAQVTTVAPPPPPTGITFGRDPNDLTNARGLLPNDRPHIFRAMSSVDIPRTGLVVAANLQYFTGKPWAATTQVNLARTGQGALRVMLEPRGTRRLSSQTLLDLRVSRAIAVHRAGRIDVMLDVLNALNDRAEEGLATDDLFSPNFARPTIFMDPRRAMIGVRWTVGR